MSYVFQGNQGLSQSSTGSHSGNSSCQSTFSSHSYDLRDKTGREHIYTTIGLYQMKEMKHENLVQFFGVCVEPPNICLVIQYCKKGSLEDVFGASDIDLEWMFKLSFAYDIVNGMDFIHNSTLKFHGNLKPSTCLVDSRLQIKLSGFGLWEFKYGGKNKLSLMENPDYE
ncbi:Guanylate cyclase 2G, partial [Xenotaenia resolanae]